MVDLFVDQAYTPFTVAILWSVVGFACYYFLSMNRSLTGKIWSGTREPETGVAAVVIQRLWGLIFLGILPVLLVLLVFKDSPGEYGLSFSFTQTPPWWSYLVVPVILVAGFFSASSPSNLARYPQMRIKQWTHGVLFLSALSWIIFLIAYEFLFRGFVLYATLTVMEPWQAVAVNCALYAFAHFYKGPGETFGAIPLGILLCYLTLQTGNIWSAVIIHSVMALSNEWYAIRAQPDMQVKRRK